MADEQISWDDFDIEGESVSKKEANEYEKEDVEVPVGLYECVVVKSTPKQIDFTAYSCLGTKLRFQIEKCLEIEAKPIKNQKDGEYLIGCQNLSDDIAFWHEDEKPGMAKRRKIVALKLGIAKPGGAPLYKDDWKVNVIGQKVILKVVENNYMKNGKEVIGRPKIAFFGGYMSVAAQKAAPKKVEEWDDI